VPLEIIGKTKAKILEVDPQQQKLGQTDMRPAAMVRFKMTVPNDILEQISPEHRRHLFEKSTRAAAKQGTLDGVQPVSELNALTDAGQRLGAHDWEYEQTGCRLVVYQGFTGDHDIKLKDVTVDKVKLQGHDGGALDLQFDAYAADLDRDTVGDLGVLVKHEVDIELEAPKVSKSQKTIEPEEQELTPLKAMQEGAPAGGEAPSGEPPPGGWPFPVSATEPSTAKVTKKPATRAARKAANADQKKKAA
jgi:hypothetical protein